MQMIDVIQKLKEIADRSPEEIGRAIIAAKKMSGGYNVSEASDAQKAARNKFKDMIKGKKTSDKEEDDDKSSSSKKPDFLDVDKDGNKKESMATASKEKVDEDVEITLSGSDAVLAEILKLAGQIGVKTSGDPVSVSSPSSLPAPSTILPSTAPSMGVPADGPLPNLDKIMGSDPIDSATDDEIVFDSFDASTSPNPEIMDIDSIISAGDDLHKEKTASNPVSGGDNPLSRRINFSN